MYSNVSKMDANIESDTSQNTNSLGSSGYFVENYFEDDSDKENYSINIIDAILESSEDKVKTLVPFLPRRNSLPLSVPLTTKIVFLSFALFCFLLLNSLFLCNGLAYILCSTSHISDRVLCHLVL